MGVFSVICLEKDGSAGRIFFLGLNNSYAYCNPHYASPTFMCYYLLEIYLHFISLWVTLLISFREGRSDCTIKHNYFCLI